ncbi:MAG TPA: inorganic phosphate transporter [Pseudothermotoga sp.]|jgi:PiT family inorganic phosphate transporter|nr:MAG: Phosphate transporter [Pseudothermotoga lettingae]HBT25434.1 inorganic phosphate transporter [Pseudothermotoga sp.]
MSIENSFLTKGYNKIHATFFGGRQNVSIIYLMPGIFIGIILGANDAASIFGPLVAVGSVRYRTASIFSAIFVILGATVGGANGLETLNTLTVLERDQSAVATLAAALTVILMILIKAPASVSQAVVGSLIGVAFLNGAETIRWDILIKIVAIWIITPLSAILISFSLYRLVAYFFRKLKNVRVQDLVLQYANLMALCYSAYSLGANNVANVARSFVTGESNLVVAQLLGGVSIAIGIMFFSKRMTFVIGKSIIVLDHFSSLISGLALATNVFVFSMVGVPVSATQSAIGSVVGTGMSRGQRLSSRKTKIKIILGLVLTPSVSGIISVLLHLILRGG